MGKAPSFPPENDFQSFLKFHSHGIIQIPQPKTFLSSLHGYKNMFPWTDAKQALRLRYIHTNGPDHNRLCPTCHAQPDSSLALLDACQDNQAQFEIGQAQPSPGTPEANSHARVSVNQPRGHHRDTRCEVHNPTRPLQRYGLFYFITINLF